MEDLLPFDAILIPTEGSPRLFGLLTSRYDTSNEYGHRVVRRWPHPELDMSLSHHPRWLSQSFESIYRKRGGLQNTYRVFYPRMQTSGAPLAVNRWIREIQGHGFRDESAWRGDVVVVKYAKSGDIVNCAASDFVLVKTYLALHYPQHKLQQQRAGVWTV